MVAQAFCLMGVIKNDSYQRICFMDLSLVWLKYPESRSLRSDSSRFQPQLHLILSQFWQAELGARVVAAIGGKRKVAAGA